MKKSERVNTMNDLINTTALVKDILEQDKQCRSSDSFLYLKVLSAVAKQKNITLDFMTVPDFLVHHHGKHFPPFESVRRARQKIQAAHPELAACESVAEFRSENEAKYKAFARGEA